MDESAENKKQEPEGKRGPKPKPPSEKILTVEILNHLEKLASLGMTEVEIAYIIGITEQTLNAWKKDDKIVLVLKNGKAKADAKVIESLYRRACGYSHPEDHIAVYQGQVIVTPTIKHYAPDTMAIMYWLNNRRREDWKLRQSVEHSGEIGINKVLTEKEIDEQIQKEMASMNGELEKILEKTNIIKDKPLSLER